MSRAIGETMTVLMVAGGAAVIPHTFLEPVRPMTAAIAAEIISKWCAENVVEGERYNLMSCMGYGTLRHRDAIKEHGLIEHHRRLFMKNTLPSSMQSLKTECLIQD